MSKIRHITFNGFTLDTSNEVLRRGSERIHLRPKMFALLKYLAARPGQLVTKNELQARQQCEEVPLGYLDEASIGEYLMQRFPGHRFPIETAPWIRHRTGGNPLFMVHLLDHLTARGLIVRRHKHWILNVTPENAELTVPQTIQQKA